MTDILWFCPVYKGARISQTFDQHPYSGKGIDFAVVNGTDVQAMRGGRVAQMIDKYAVNQMDDDLGYGNRIVLDHGKIDGAIYSSWYAHLSPNIPVKVGDMVSTGQMIAKSNNNGSSSGPHLHAMGKKNNTPFDWWPYVVYTIEEVDTGIIVTPEFQPPAEYPTIRKARLLKGITLKIRQRANTVSKVLGFLSGEIEFAVIDGAWVGSDYWLHVGIDQYCAAHWQGYTFVEFLS